MLRAVCAEAFNPDEDEEDKEPRVGCGIMYIFSNEYEGYDFQCNPPGGPHHRCILFLILQVTYPKTDEQRQKLQEVCRDILLFKNLDPVSRFLHKPPALLWFVICHL